MVCEPGKFGVFNKLTNNKNAADAGAEESLRLRCPGENKKTTRGRVIFFDPVWDNLSLGELGSTTSCFETVLLSFLHSGVSGEESCLLEKGAVGIVSEKECAGYTVADCACLTGDTAAVYVSNDVVLADSVCNAEGLVDDELEGFEAEVIVYVTAVDGDLAGTGINSYASDGALSSARTIEIRLSTCIHYSVLSFPYISTSYGTGF